jgi:hypothetical protein
VLFFCTCQLAIHAPTAATATATATAKGTMRLVNVIFSLLIARIVVLRTVERIENIMS